MFEVVGRIPPAASLLRRYEFSLDVALILLERQRSQETLGKLMRFSWSDSPPMGGFDWSWSQYHEVHIDDLAELFDAIIFLSDETKAFNERLQQRRDRPAVGDAHDSDEELDGEGMEPLPSWRPALATIRRSIRKHINPPAS